MGDLFFSTKETESALVDLEVRRAHFSSNNCRGVLLIVQFGGQTFPILNIDIGEDDLGPKWKCKMETDVFRQ